MARMTIKNRQSAIGNRQFVRLRSGSAIILAIVLTSLLAIIGVLFLISSRVDSIATSAIADNKDLTFAVDTVIAQISQDLAADIKNSDDPCCYADYPDPCNYWLACLEPYSDAGIYKWRQVSSIYTEIAVQNVEAIIIPDYQPTISQGAPADADGDGVSDSIWVTIQDMNSNKGKPIFAAVRIIDNGGMLNVNTGFKFDPGVTALADGSSQTQINLLTLSNLDQTHLLPAERESRLLSYRCNTEPINIDLYKQNVIWQYGLPVGAYTPFDISDELVLRNRYILNSDQMTTRIENLWMDSFKDGLEVPISSPSEMNSPPRFWEHRVDYNDLDPNIYDYRHIATTYNCDRIIDPNDDKMLNINSASMDNVLYVRDSIERAVVSSGLDTSIYDPNQIAINLIDFIDDTNDVNFIEVVKGATTDFYFGFERPCIYISEIAANFTIDDSDNRYRSYAIELYNPYMELFDPAEWRIDINGTTFDLTGIGNNKYYIIKNIDPFPNANIPINPANPAEVITHDEPGLNFAADNIIKLQRIVNGLNPANNWITVDEVNVPTDFIDPPSGTGKAITNIYSRQRCIAPHKCIRRLWTPTLDTPNLGNIKSFDPEPDVFIQAHPANNFFTNVGEIGQLFYSSTYEYIYGGFRVSMLPPYGVTEPQLLIDLADPNFQRIFKYITVFDPNEPIYGGHPADESRIKGRLNINTAPWFVIAQLPWVTNDLAQAIVAYRDKIDISGLDYYSESRRIVMGVTYPVREDKGFVSIGELMNVTNIHAGGVYPQYDIGKYAYPATLDLNSLPDLSPNDGADDDFEERDVIFARISNLVTVRSDVFTAYILVRIGPNGPQKRVIAILDRSAVTPAGGKIKIVAIQNVPDPR